MTRRPHGTGSVYQEHNHPTCPPVGSDGERPEHDCHGRWIGTYEAGWTVRGTRRRRKVYGRTKAEVKRKLRDRQREAEIDTAATGARPTVRTWAETWLATTVRELRPEAWRANRSNTQRWIIPTIGHKRLDRLTPGDVRSVAKACTDAGRSPATARRVHVVLVKMLRDALVEGHAVPPRVLELKAPSAGENDRDAIPLDHAMLLLAAAKGTDDESRWLAAFLQGLRPAEALGLTWDSVDTMARTVDVSWQLKALPYNTPRDRASGFRVPVGYEARQVRGAWHRVRPKTARGKRILMLDTVLAASLDRWRETSKAGTRDLVWPRTDAADRAAFYALQETAGVGHESGRHYLVYECRHTAASLVRALGYDDQTITAMMGHASILSSQAYIHVDQMRQREAADALAAKLGLGSPPRIES